MGTVFATLFVAAIAPGLQAQETHTLSGQVVDARGEPVPLAEVWVSARDGDAALAKTRTDAEGVFVLGRVPHHPSWQVHAQAEGTTRQTTWASPSGPPMRLQLQDAATLRGTFVDAAGKAIAGAHVVAAFDLARVSRSCATAVTGEDGGFELPRVPLGVVDVRACKQGVGFGAARLHVTGDAVCAVQVGTDADRVLEVAVRGVPGDAAARPQVRLLPYRNGSLQTLPDAMTGGEVAADGTWRSLPLPDWEYVVSVSCEGFAIAPAQHRRKPGESARAGFSATRIEAQPWAGVLHDADDRPLANVRLALRASNSALSAEATTDGEGWFTFACTLGEGSSCYVHSLDPAWTLTQEKTGKMLGVNSMRHLTNHETTVALATPLALRAIPAASAGGRVVDAEGRAVPFARVELQHRRSSASRGRYLPFAWAVCDRQGRYEFSGLHPTDDPVRLVVASGRGAAESETFALANGGSFAAPDVALTPNGAVAGVVRDAVGKPVVGARVWLRTWDFATGNQRDGSVTEAITDRNGTYRFAGVAPGGYWLHWTLEESTPKGTKVEPFELASGETKTVDLR